MVFILRPNGGHVDGFACFGVQTSLNYLKLTRQPHKKCFSVTSNARNMTAHTELAEKYVVIYQLPETFSKS